MRYFSTRSILFYFTDLQRSKIYSEKNWQPRVHSKHILGNFSLNIHTKYFLINLFLFYFIRFANLVLNQHTHTENKDINDTIQAGTPQQLASIIAGPTPITAGPNSN